MGAYVYRNDSFYNQKTIDYKDNIREQLTRLGEISGSTPADIMIQEIRYDPVTNTRSVVNIPNINNEKWFDTVFSPAVLADSNASYVEFIVNSSAELASAIANLSSTKLNKIHINDDIAISVPYNIMDFCRVWVTFANSHKITVSAGITAFTMGFCSEMYMDVSGTTSTDEFMYLGTGSKLFKAGHASKITFNLRLNEYPAYDLGGAIRSAVLNDSTIIENEGCYCEVYIDGAIDSDISSDQLKPIFINSNGVTVIGFPMMVSANLIDEFGASIADTGALPPDMKKITGLSVKTFYGAMFYRYHNYLI